MGTKLNRFRKMTAVAAISTMAVAGLAACGNDATTSSAEAKGKGPESVGTGPNTPNPSPLSKKTTVTVLYSAPIDAFLSLLLAQEMGEFAKENLDVKLEQVPTTDGAVLLAQKKADVQIAGMNASAFNVMGSQSDPPINFVTTGVRNAPPAEGTYVSNDFITDGEIDAKKIEGQSVAPGIGGGGFGNPGAAGFFLAGQEAGLDADAVKFATLTTPQDIAQGMLNGQIAGGFLFEPGLSMLLKEKDRFTQVWPTVPNCIFVANASWLQEQPAVAAAFFRAIMRTNRTYLQGEFLKDDKVVSAIAKIEQIPEETVRAKSPSVYDPNLDATDQREAFDVMQEMFRGANVLSFKEDLSVDDLFDETPIEDVLAGKY